MKKKENLLLLVFVVMLLSLTPILAVQTVSAARVERTNSKIANRTITMRVGQKKQLRVLSKRSKWKLQKVRASKKYLRIAYSKKKSIVTIKGMKQTPKVVVVKVYLKKKNARKVLKYKVRVIPSNPRISNRKVTLKIGETKQLKVLPRSVNSKNWNLIKVTTSNKKCVTVSRNKKKLTVKIKGKKKASKITVKIYLRMKNSSWKKYKKYVKTRNKVLKCTVNVISNSPQNNNVKLKKINTSRWKFDQLTFIYDGNIHRPQLLGVPKSVRILYSMKGAKEAGTYSLKAKFVVPRGYKPVADMSVKYTIKKATPDMTGVVYEDAKFKWNGKEHYLHVNISTLPQGVLIDHYKGNGQSDVGIHDVTVYFKVEDTKNYNVPEPMTRRLTIFKVSGISKVDIDVSGIKYTGLTTVYDKTEKYVGYDQSTLPNGISNITFEGDGKIDAGTYDVTVNFTVSDTSKYNEVSPITVQLTIKKATLDMAGVSYKDAEVMWDGNKHSIYVDVSTLPQGVSVDHYEGNEQSDVGTHNVTVYFAVKDTKNYNIPEPMTRTLKIFKTSSVTKVNIDVSGIKYTGLTTVYDKTEKYVGYDQSTLPNGISNITFEGDGKIDAGTYNVTVNFTISDTSKYNEVSPITVQLTIKKATLDMTGVSYEDAEVMWDGNKHSIYVDVSTLPQGVSVDHYEGNEQSDVGSYDVTVYFAVDDTKNYVIPESITRTLTILKSGVTKVNIDVSGIKYTGLTTVYDKTEKYIGYDNSTLPDGISNISFEGDGKTDVGTYDVTVNFTISDANKYNEVSPITLQLTILKASIYATLDEQSFNVDNNQITTNIDKAEDVNITYTLNGEACENVPTITRPGRYLVTSDFEVDTNHYEKPEPLQAVYHIKRNNVWYELLLNIQVVDGKAIVEIYLENVRVPLAKDYTVLVLGFDLSYDKSVLQYEYSNGFIPGEGWDGEYNPDRNHDEETIGVDARDISITYEDYEQGGMPEQTKVCTIVYNILPGESLENFEFTLENAVVSAEADEDLPFTYDADSETIVLNPTENAPKEYVLYMNWDVINDANYEFEEAYPEDKETYLEALREYMFNQTGENQ